MLRKVISGGQTGADQAGLVAAVKFGLETGGWIPHGYRTETGREFSLAKYHLIETPSTGYVLRTKYNVQDSDATVYFASNWGSLGTKCTLKAVKEQGKPLFTVDLQHVKSEEPFEKQIAKGVTPHIEMVRFLQEVEILNVAGHRESGHPGVFAFVVNYLSAVFMEMGLNSVEDSDTLTA